MSRRPRPSEDLKQQAELTRDAAPFHLTPSVSSTHNQASEDLEFSKLQDQHQLLFSQELEQHQADYEERQMEFEAFLQELDSQFFVAESSYKERFDGLVKEQDDTHQKKLDVRVMQFSAAEKARQDIFLEVQSCRNTQFLDLKDDWEKRFAEGRKLREKLLSSAGEEMGVIAAALVQEFEERFKQEEKEREIAFRRLVERLKRPQSASEDESRELDPVPLTPDPTRPETNELTASPSEYNSIYDSDGCSDSFVCGCDVEPSTPSSEPPEVPNNNNELSQSVVAPPSPPSPPPAKPVSKSCSIDYTERVLSWLEQCPDMFSEGDQPVHGSPQLEGIVGSPAGDFGSITVAEPKQSVPVPPPEDSNVELPPTHQEEFEDAQAKRQQLFEKAESASFAAISGFNTLFEERLSGYRTRYSSSRKESHGTWKVLDHARDVKENGRNEMARIAETRRKGVLKELLKRTQDELDLATKKEASWDQIQKRLAARAGEKLLKTKRNDIERRSEETMRHWEDTLSSLLGHAFTVSPGEPPLLHSAYVSRIRIYGKDEPPSRASSIASSICSIDESSISLPMVTASVNSELTRESVASQHSIAEPPTFAFRSLFSKTGPLIKRSLPVPSSPPSERSRTEVGASKLDDFQSAQQQRDLAFRSSAEEREKQHGLNEAKRRKEFKLGQGQRMAEFREMRLGQDRRFQELLIHIQKRFVGAEASREVNWNKAELAREKSFWEHQESRARRWTDARSRLLAASFDAERASLALLESWLGRGERWFQTEKDAFEQDASTRKERFEELLDRVSIIPRNAS